MPLRVFATDVVERARRSRAHRSATMRTFAPARYGKAATKSAPSSRSTIRRIGSPKPRPPGSFAASSVKNAAIRGDDERSSPSSPRRTRASSRSSPLKVQRREVRDVPLHGADPALLGDDDGDRLALDHRLEISMSAVSGASAKLGAPLAEGRVGPKGLRASRICQAIVFHCTFSETSSVLDLPPSPSSVRRARA